MKIEEFVPEILQESGWATYGIMMVQVEKCPICEKYMVEPPGNKWNNSFPKAMNYGFDTQLSKAGWVRRSDVTVDNHDICQECADAGKATFLCTLCGSRRPADEIKDSFGEPAEYLCTTCYGAIPAKEWDAEVRRLQTVHRYDYE